MAEAWPVGRQTEYQRIVDHVASGRSAVLLICGAPGSGRSHLLRHVGRAAHDAGFRVAGLDGSLAVTDSSTVANFRMQLAATFGADAEAVDDESTDSVSPDDGLWWQGYRAVMTLLNREPDDEREVARLLHRAGPALVALDGFSPTGPMRRWVTGRLVSDVRSAEDPIVLIISGPPDTVESLRELADEVIELGELDRAEVRDHFRSRTAAVTPPLSEEELDAYCDAASRRPEVFRDLSLVFDVLARSAA